MRLRYRATLGNRLLEFPDGIVVQLTFPVGHAKVDMETWCVSETRKHVLENQACACDFVQLDIVRAQKVGDVKGRLGHRSCFQVLASAFIVALAEENLSQQSPRLPVLRIVL